MAAVTKYNRHMNKNVITFTAILGMGVASLFAANEPLVPEEFIPPAEAFAIKQEKPDAVVLADTMTMKDGQAVLEGRVKATRANDILTCSKATLWNEPESMLATIKPNLFRKESILETKVIREMNISAKNIYVRKEDGYLSASDTVVVSIDETTWDLATHTRVIITADDLIGVQDSERLIFSGHVKIYEPEGENPSDGKGNRLDYLRKRSIAVLSGNAYVNTWEVNPETNMKERRTLTGKRVMYNTLTKEGVSE